MDLHVKVISHSDFETNFDQKMEQLYIGESEIQIVFDYSGGYDYLLKVLPFEIRYLIHCCISAHKFFFASASEVLQLIELISVKDRPFVESVLETLYYTTRLSSFRSLLKDLGGPIDEDDEYIDTIDFVRRVLVTPLRVCPQAPEADSATNRIIRSFIKHRTRFVRISYVEEHFGSVLSAKTSDIIGKFTDGKLVTPGRIMLFVINGIYIAGRLFKFLAYSNSQLREQSHWAYDEDYREEDPIFPSCNQIRESMGGNLNFLSLICQRLQ